MVLDKKAVQQQKSLKILRNSAKFSIFFPNSKDFSNWRPKQGVKLPKNQ
jgi:hypothetical protein